MVAQSCSLLENTNWNPQALAGDHVFLVCDTDVGPDVGAGADRARTRSEDNWDLVSSLLCSLFTHWPNNRD